MPQQAPVKTSGNVGAGFLYAFGYLVVIWSVHLVNVFVFRGTLTYFGVHPLDLSSIWHIFTAPLIHGSSAHIAANSIPGAIFCFLIGLSGHRAYWEVTGIVCVVSGLGTWLVGGIGTSHIGASGLIYGWLAYLVVRGIFNRSAGQVVLGIVLAFAYSGLIWGVLPTDEGVSWQAHLFGAIGGFIAGATITSDDPPALQAKRAREAQMRQARR
ncbi:rhomboid family intramembrane serine protease [Corynebacterium gerontici]|nr:rhomboid family intramembrane serine protease [Corynebacterium gerontici]